MTVICALVFSQTRRDEVLTNALLCTNGVVPGWSATRKVGNGAKLTLNPRLHSSAYARPTSVSDGSVAPAHFDCPVPADLARHLRTRVHRRDPLQSE